MNYLLDVVVIIFLSAVILFVIFYKRKKEHTTVGGTILKEEEDLISKKLVEKGVSNKKAIKLSAEIIENIINKYKNPVIVSMKVNNILDKCSTTTCKDINTLLKYAGINREMEQVYVPKTNEEEFSDLYECPRCNVKRCTFKEVMLRAIDEPLAVKCVCENCGLRFQPDD